MQTTLTRDVQFVGTGLHSGRPARMTLRPAAANHGVRFRRTDVTDRDPVVDARYDAVVDTRLNTRLANAAGTQVSTVEHLMAAIAGAGLHNVMVDIDGPEVPIMDGSSRQFIKQILGHGIRRLNAPLMVWQIQNEVSLVEGDVRASLAPHDGILIRFDIDFADPAIGVQSAHMDMANGTFVRELADCRTFCMRSDVDQMQAHGLALGGTLDNAVVIEDGVVLNPEGFRRRDECVRHKMLDALGDMALAGHPILGAYTGSRAGHGPTNRLLRKLFDTPGAAQLVPCPDGMLARLPGTHVDPQDLASAG